MHRWQEVQRRTPSARRRLGRVPTLLVVVAAAVTLILVIAQRGGSQSLIVILNVVVAVSLVRIASARFDRAFGRFLHRFGHLVGRALSVVLLLAVFVLVMVPVWAIARLTGWNALEPVRGWRGTWHPAEPWWRARPPRPYLAEPARPLPSRLHAIGVVAVVALVGAALLYDARDGGDTRAHSVDDQVVAPDTGIFSGYFSLAAYEDQPWAREYFRGLGTIPFSFDPYLTLRVPDTYASPGLNITDRVRNSYEQPDLDDDEAVDLWFLGGSAGFGVGQRDEHTIASELVRLAEAEGIPLRVQNLAMSGYVTWQDIALLSTALLEREPQPDLIVDYNGNNDLALYMLSGGAQRVSSLFADQVYGVLDAAGDRVFGPGLPDYLPRNDGVDVDNAMRLYGQEVEFGRRLAAGWDIPIEFYFQPVLWTTEQEASIQPVLEAKEIDRAIYEDNAATWAEARQQLPEGVVDLADSLDAAEGPVYADSVHTNEEGARLVAVAMFEHLRPQLLELAAED